MDRKIISIAVVSFTACALWLTAQQPNDAQKKGGPRARPNGKKVVLAWADTRNGIAQHDSVSHAMAVIERLGYESGLYDTYFRTDSSVISKTPRKSDGTPASGGPSLANVDAIFFLGHREIDLPLAQKTELAAFVRDEGKGFVAAHTATTAFDSWPEFGELLGGRYDDHPWNTTTAPLIIEDEKFPAMKHWQSGTLLTDEFYQTKGFSRDKIRVLMRLDTKNLPDRPNLRLRDGDFPLAWAKMYGKGRVFYSSLGHDAKTWDNPDVYHMYFEAIKWALGLTEGDVSPRPLAKE